MTQLGHGMGEPLPDAYMQQAAFDDEAATEAFAAWRYALRTLGERGVDTPGFEVSPDTDAPRFLPEIATPSSEPLPAQAPEAEPPTPEPPTARAPTAASSDLGLATASRRKATKVERTVQATETAKKPAAAKTVQKKPATK